MNSRSKILLGIFLIFSVTLTLQFIRAAVAFDYLKIGIVRNVFNQVYGNSLLKTIKPGENITKNQRLRTSFESGAELKFNSDLVLYVGELSNLLLDRYISDEKKGLTVNNVQFIKGFTRFVVAPSEKIRTNIRLPKGVLSVKNATVDVMVHNGITELIVREGDVRVDIVDKSLNISPGQIYGIPARDPAQFAEALSNQMKNAVAKTLTMFGVKQAKASKVPDSLSTPQLSGVSDIRNLLYLDLTYGRIVIKMEPELAPKHVIRIMELARKGFYNGHLFHNVVPGFVVETGDPTGTGMGGSGKKLNAEISNTSFERGVVGMKRDLADLNSADSQFFILLGRAEHLEGRYTVWGRVLKGIKLLDRLRTGSPPPNPDHIVKLHLASDYKEEEKNKVN